MATMGDEDRRARQLERLRFWRRACAERSPDLATYGTEGGERPFVYFHGDYEAGGTYMARFAAEFGRPLASIGPHGLRGDPIPPTVEAMAAERMALVLSVCPTGPFRLGGYCNGAIVAYETARLLVRAGHEVERVVMVEPPSLSIRPAYRAIHAAVAWLSRLMGGDAAGRVGRIMRVVGRVNRASTTTRGQAWDLVRTRLLRRARPAQATLTETERKGLALYNAYARILPGYLPPRTDFPVTVLSSGKDAAGRACGLYDGPSWRRLCANFAFVPLAGTHLSCLMETTGEVVRLVRDALDGATPPVAAAPAPDRTPLAWGEAALGTVAPLIPAAVIILGGLLGADLVQ
jgi:thioesterase domain-containing protein